jgi:hypothetical protein
MIREKRAIFCKMLAMRKVNFNAVSLIKEGFDHSRMGNSGLQHARLF